jgi:NTP pyrophosphatase (non-canonical NTP hydrolase)
MHSDKQVKIKGGSSLSYHAFVEKLVKRFERAKEIFTTPVDKTFLTMNAPVEEIESITKAFDAMAEKLEICHSAIGLHTEAGEVADVLKAHAIYGKPLDREALVKELGDVRFWIQDIQNKFHISDHEIAQGNADKLSERYEKIVYSDVQAIARNDKKYCVAIWMHDTYCPNVISPFFEHIYEAQNHMVRHPDAGIYEKTIEGLKKVK